MVLHSYKAGGDGAEQLALPNSFKTETEAQTLSWSARTDWTTGIRL